MNYKIAVGLIIAFFVMIFIVQNVAVVEVRFLFWSIAMSRALLMTILLVAGIVIGWLIGSLGRMKKRP